jgi:uncharacterized protein YutE (UPF0331/DUF86 family)
MSINEEIIEARIREINDALQTLKLLKAKTFKGLTLHEKLSMRYLIIQLVEATSSICMHILLNLFNEKPEGFPECFTRLGVKGIIPQRLSTKLASAARLRNLLVHRYWEIDDTKVYNSVKKGLKDFEEFVLCMREFLKRNAQ